MKMRIPKALRSNPKRTARWALALSVALVFSGLGVSKFGHHFSRAAAENSIYLVTTPASPATGDTITVEVHANSGADAVNAAQADLTYDATKLQFVAIDAAGSPYDVSTPGNTGGDGKVQIARGAFSNLTGDQILAKVSFKVLASGSSDIAVADTSQMLRADDQVDVTKTRTGSTVAVADSNGTPPPNPTPTPDPTPTPTPTPTPSPSGDPSAGPGKVYLSPASGNYEPGATFTVAVRVDSATEAVNAAEAHLNYDTSLLEFVSISATGSPYDVATPGNNGGDGKVDLARGAFTNQTGDQLLSNVTFKALAPGTATIDVTSSSQALRAEDQANVVGTRTGATMTIAAAAPAPSPTPSPTPTPTPTPNPTPTPTPTPSPTSRPTPTPTPSSSSSTTKPSTTPTTSTSLSITPQGSTSPVAAPGDSTIEVSTPTTVQPTDTSSDISKVEYYLNGVKVATVNSPPYSYEVDTAGLRNGSYQLTTKTYKSDGSIATASHTLNVANPMNIAQISLQAKHFWWLFAIIAILMVDVVTSIYLRHKNGRSGGSLLDVLLPWRNGAEELSFANNSYPSSAANPYYAAPEAQSTTPQYGTDNKLDHFTPNLPSAGQVVDPKASDPNDPYNQLPH